MQTFIAEVLANVRATVSGLGGNGLVAYRMTECLLVSNPHKNQVGFILLMFISYNQCSMTNT